MRIGLLLWILFFLSPSLTWAQAPPTPQQLAQARGTSNEVPMFGGQPKTPEQRAADQQFIATALQQHGTAQAAAHVYTNFGWGYLQQGSPVVAIKRFNQAWLLDSTLADVYYGFSAWQQPTNPTEAERLRRLGQRHDANNQALIRYYSSLAYGQSLRRDYAGALATNAQILALDAHHAFANGRAGFWYMQQQDTARATDYLTRAIQLNPRDSVAFLNRGWVRYGQKRYTAAIADFTAAARISPRYITAYANRALANTEAGNYAAAVADNEQCLQLVPPRDKGQFYRTIGMLKLWLHDTAGACTAFSQALNWGDTPAAEREIRKLQKENCR
ncbi:tetratricopeptide repeat protein [Hymenobacter perfusus]|uniref:Tetratricopeptide repeat protein n=1 Tax=Hymenobacter perfusus TaxID=1236770 RepID=A0A428JZI2_9BACT|nr:tetratricopeptide repeat protein [Hymenobacter perfusus]RSK39590.1 tetratricopeptide repeat protein [Hymenobacter perfusus]